MIRPVPRFVPLFLRICPCCPQSCTEDLKKAANTAKHDLSSDIVVGPKRADPNLVQMEVVYRFFVGAEINGRYTDSIPKVPCAAFTRAGAAAERAQAMHEAVWVLCPCTRLL